jgi:excisionase family DNA binding protein
MNATETRAQFLSPREAAKLLGLSRQTIYSQIHRGALPAVRVGSTTIRIPALLVSELQRTRTGPLSNEERSTP